MKYALVDTFAASKRGRQNWMIDSRDFGEIISFHRSYENAEKKNEKIQRQVEKNNGPGCYLPTSIVQLKDGKYKIGAMITRRDLKEE